MNDALTLSMNMRKVPIPQIRYLYAKCASAVKEFL